MTRLFERAIQRALLYIATMSGPLEQVEETIEEIHQEGPYRTAQPNQGDIEADRKAVSKICEEEKARPQAWNLENEILDTTGLRFNKIICKPEVEDYMIHTKMKGIKMYREAE